MEISQLKSNIDFKNFKLPGHWVVNDTIYKKDEKTFKEEFIKLFSNQSFRKYVSLDYLYDSKSIIIHFIPFNFNNLLDGCGYYIINLVQSYMVYSLDMYNIEDNKRSRYHKDLNTYQFKSLYKLFLNMKNEYTRLYKETKLFNPILKILSKYDSALPYNITGNLVEEKDHQLYSNIIKNLNNNYPNYFYSKEPRENKLNQLHILNSLYAANKSFEFNYGDKFGISIGIINDTSHIYLDITNSYSNQIRFMILEEPNIEQSNSIFIKNVSNKHKVIFTSKTKHGLALTNTLLESLEELTFIFNDYYKENNIQISTIKQKFKDLYNFILSLM